jgi:hypothetical protein
MDNRKCIGMDVHQASISIAGVGYPLAVSRRTPVVCSIRRSDQPSRPRAITCCCFSSLKTLHSRLHYFSGVECCHVRIGSSVGG